MTERKTLLTWEEQSHLNTALDILLGCYEGGVDSEIVRELLKEYGPGTTQREEARKLFDHLKVIGSIPVDGLETDGE